MCAIVFFTTRKSVVLYVCKSGLRVQNISFDRFDNIYIFFLGVVMVQGVLKEFCQNTSIHGLSSIVEAKSSLIKRIAWFVIFVISISYAGIQLKGNVDSKLTLSIIKIRNFLRKQLKVGCSFLQSDFTMKVKKKAHV